ncbi:response regulator, partial [Salmonella enterica subsp. enterica serovar Montevideo]|nr:response regulator [Salmonella enterica subsp. enterica serovar Montevideo]
LAGDGVDALELMGRFTPDLMICDIAMPRMNGLKLVENLRNRGVDKHLVIYDEGNLFSAPRAWWMLRTFGAEKVSILAGGLAGWQR